MPCYVQDTHDLPDLALPYETGTIAAFTLQIGILRLSEIKQCAEMSQLVKEESQDLHSGLQEAKTHAYNIQELSHLCIHRTALSAMPCMLEACNKCLQAAGLDLLTSLNKLT